MILVLSTPVFGQSDPKADPKSDSKEVKKVVATVDADGVQRVAILGGGYFYNPNFVVVKVNIPVELSLTKESGMTPHDFFNSALFFAFAYQGRLGWRIRSRRAAGVSQDFSVVKRHRALGPILATLQPFGCLAGLITVYLHKGLWVRCPGHFTFGTVLLVVAGSAVLVSRKIRGAQPPLFFALGLFLLCSCLVQICPGLNIFL